MALQDSVTKADYMKIKHRLETMTIKYQDQLLREKTYIEEKVLAELNLNEVARLRQQNLELNGEMDRARFKVREIVIS
jgi:hypothetical protein